MKTASTTKLDLMVSAQLDMKKIIQDIQLSERQKLALTCRILFDKGHDAGVAGKITCSATKPDTYFTQRFGLGFDEISADNLMEVDHDLKPLDGEGMANPANHFHTWVYKEHPEVLANEAKSIFVPH